MSTKRKYFYYSEGQIMESGLLSPERMAAVSAAIDARIVPCCLPDGRPLKNAFIADQGEEGRFVYAHCGEPNQVDYMRRSCLPAVLTDEEFELIDKACSSAREARIDAKRFAEAEKVTQWGEGAWLGDRYFQSMDELIDHLEDDGEDWPEYVWAAEPKTVIHSIEAADVVENQIADRGWEDMSVDDLNGVTELQQALDEFVKVNADVKSYLPDYGTAILLDEYKRSRKAKGAE